MNNNKGLYGECKIGLETTFNRWKSESWEDYLSIAGAVIGWTRRTGLMSASNLIAQHMEELGTRTFSTREMAFTMLGLLHPKICRVARKEPIWVDLRGAIQRLTDTKGFNHAAKQWIKDKSMSLKAISNELALDNQAMIDAISNSDVPSIAPSVLANHKHSFPAPVSSDRLTQLSELQGMVNLDKVVEITGYGELVWTMGLIKHFNGLHPETGKHYIGLVDAKTNEPVSDLHPKTRYEEHILAHTGSRLIKHDMEPFETSQETALAYKQRNGDNVDIWENTNNSGSWFVRLLKGVLIRAAIIPSGWSARQFGISDEIINQVDPVTLFTLVATMEALVKSGITDPYELFSYFHVSKVGNTTGSTVGGMHSTRMTIKDRLLDKSANGDVMQE
ncbi:beta subunit of fatty acid synthetase [Coemansia sp. RSA 1722]|nr:beta subunit of fatty acid synthetase [Coemansia sp. RSA 1722]